jgi:hypothetical protein
VAEHIFLRSVNQIPRQGGGGVKIFEIHLPCCTITSQNTVHAYNISHAIEVARNVMELYVNREQLSN